MIYPASDEIIRLLNPSRPFPSMRYWRGITSFSYLVNNQNTTHVLMLGMPSTWLHVKDSIRFILKT